LLSTAGKKYSIPPPQMHRDGNKKSVFANLTEICKRMRRKPEHVIQFMLAEMGTTGSVDGSGRLVIKGRFQQKQVETVLLKYIGQSSPSYPRLFIYSFVWLISIPRYQCNT
jgi:translation initiation factor 2 subunit 2